MENGFKGNERLPDHHVWPDRAPRDLALRVADALQRQHCGPEDLWDELCDWLVFNNVAAPDIPASRLLSSEIRPFESNRFHRRPVLANTMELSRLIYASRHDGLGESDLDTLLEQSRYNNARDVITGALLIGEDSFLQLLEGSRKAVTQCFTRIMQDKRHSDVQIISCGGERRRIFQEWNMYRISPACIGRETMSAYLVNGIYNPALLSEFAVQDLCWTLSKTAVAGEAHIPRI